MIGLITTITSCTVTPKVSLKELGEDWYKYDYTLSTITSSQSVLYYKKNEGTYSIQFKAGDIVNVSSGFRPCDNVFEKGSKTKLIEPTKTTTKWIGYAYLTTEYSASTDFTVYCYTEEEWIADLTRKKEEEKLRKINAMKSKCRDYGFKDDTDEMGLCLIELERLALLEEQIKDIQKKNNLAILQNQQLLEQQKRQRESEALMNLVAIINGGAPKTNSTKTPIKTYPNSFSSTLTVRSNEVCPILGTPLTKQEVRGANRICYYQ